MRRARSVLAGCHLPEADAHELPSSAKRFSDGGQYRVEIPSVEGPRAMEAVVAAAAEHRVGIHRISQGSGIMLLTDEEITAMLALGRAQGIEVCLFVGPRATWDTGVQAASVNGRILGCSLRGADQLAYGIEDVLRGAALGLRSILVGDVGHLMVLGRMKAKGELPSDFVLKTSVTLPAANPPPRAFSRTWGRRPSTCPSTFRWPRSRPCGRPSMPRSISTSRARTTSGAP
jgi:hypothetical protein